MAVLVQSQQDKSWKDIFLGFGNTTIGQEGCTITDIGAISGLTPVQVNERLKAVSNGFVELNKVNWTKIKEAIPWLEFEWRGWTFDKAKVEDTVNKYGFCLVEVDYDGSPKTSGKHWVVYEPQGLMMDPLIGKRIDRSKYPLPTGYAIIKPIAAIPDTPTNPLRWIITMYSERGIDITLAEGDVRWKVQDIFDAAKKKDEAVKERDKALADLGSANGTSAMWEENYATAMHKNDKLLEEIQTIKKTNANLQAETERLTLRIESLERQLDPETTMILTKEEYLKLVNARDLSNYSLGELVTAVLSRISFKK